MRELAHERATIAQIYTNTKNRLCYSRLVWYDFVIWTIYIRVQVDDYRDPSRPREKSNRAYISVGKKNDNQNAVHYCVNGVGKRQSCTDNYYLRSLAMNRDRDPRTVG